MIIDIIYYKRKESFPFPRHKDLVQPLYLDFLPENQHLIIRKVQIDADMVSMDFPPTTAPAVEPVD